MNTAIIEFLRINPNSIKAAITEGTGIKGLQLFNILKQMTKDGQVIMQGEGNETTYSLAELKTEQVVSDLLPIVDDNIKPETNEKNLKQTNTSSLDKAEQTEGGTKENKELTGGKDITDGKDGEVKEQEEEKNEDPAKSTSRDSTKYTFEKETYGKGPLVRAIVAKFVADNPSTTYMQLKEAFPDTLMKRFGVFEEVGKAKTLSGTRDRYFFKAEHIIVLGDKKQVCVCSQWTAGLVLPLIEAAKKAGYKIK